MPEAEALEIAGIPGVLSGPEAADLLGISVPLLTRLARDGVIERSGRGEYPTRALITGFLQYERAKAARAAADAGADLKRERALEIALRRRRVEGELITTAAARSVVDDVCGQLRSDLESIPAAVTRDLTQRAKIEAAIAAALKAAADRCEEASLAVSQGGDDPAAGNPDDTGPVGEE